MAPAQHPLTPVLLSASTPDPRRDPKYSAKLDLVAIREAVCAAAEVILPDHLLVFGGHPTISPLIAAIAQRLGYLDRVTIFQSEFFRALVPSSSLAFPQIRWVPEVASDKQKSLDEMRGQMLHASVPFRAAFFVGGMEGVDDEMAMFRQQHPGAAFWPLASTGGAARIVFVRDRDAVLMQPAATKLPRGKVEDLLTQTTTYRHVVRELLALS